MHNNQQLYSNLIQNHITILNDRPKKGDHFYFSTQEERSGRKWLFLLHFPLCHTFVIHFMSEERRLNVVFTDVSTPTYLTLTRLANCMPTIKQQIRCAVTLNASKHGQANLNQSNTTLFP